MANWFRRETAAIKNVGEKVVAAIESDLKTLHMVSVDILDHGANVADGVLDKAKTERDRLIAEIEAFKAHIADRTEKLRHAGVVIEAFEAAQKALEAFDAAPQAAPADPAPVAAPAPELDTSAWAARQ